MNGKKLTVISLFAGCGGSSLGYKMAGFKELLAIDFDRNAVETFKLNFKEVPIWQKDITQIKGKDILDFCDIKEGELDVLDGSPPCQGFSTAGKRKVYDRRNDLVLDYIRLVDELQPKVFVMENVSGMVKGTMKGLFREYMLKMKALNYTVKCKLMNAKYYNVPQSRERLIWIGVRKNLEKECVFPKGSRKLITVRKALKECPSGISYGSKNILKLWKYLGIGANGSTIPLLIKQKYGYNGPCFSCIKVNPNKPSATILKEVAGDGGYFHWSEKRRLYVSELKRLSSFPDTFELKGKEETKINSLGNSVPPNFMYAIAKTIKEEILI